MALSLNDLPPKQQWMVAGGLCLALGAIYYLQFWRPSSTEITRVGNEIAALRGEVQTMEAIANSLPELEAELAALERQLTVLTYILPASYETADLLRGVATLAQQSNLDITDLEFKEPVPYEFYAESPIELELTGSYHDLARFFDRIGKFARIINIDEVDVRSVDDSPTDTVEANIVAMTFFFLEEETDGENLDELIQQ